MALYQELPVFADVYTLTHKVFLFTQDYPREYKFTLGQDMKRDSLVLLRSIRTVNPPGTAFEGSNPSPATSSFLPLICISTTRIPTNNICSGHEFQHQAPANWTATLHRGGVLRVKTRPIDTTIGKRGSN
jgi:hypothetical protein